jgi:hypothetical protein
MKNGSFRKVAEDISVSFLIFSENLAGLQNFSVAEQA